MAETLREGLARRTARGELWESERGDGVRCFACGHRCFIPAGREGICKVRFNQFGELRVPWGYVASLQLDPIEKKPFFHALPGSQALSFGMLGCDLHCAYCQNWVTSQALRDPTARSRAHEITPAAVVEAAKENGASTVVSTYNEPLITAEWGVAVFEEAQRHGLKTAFVSNGNGTKEVLDYLQPRVDFMKIDLKGFSDKRYRELGGVLANILDTIKAVHERGVWLELVTLLVPGFNDSDDEVRDLCRFVASVSKEIPWHVSAFHPDYKMRDRDSTATKSLVRSCEIASEEGLQYVYAGNQPGMVGDWESTFCPKCKERLIERKGFRVLSSRLSADGRCPACAVIIPGRWA